MSTRVAAALKLEAELERLIAGFAHEHGPLIRQACEIEPRTDLVPVVVTTMFGHVASRMRRLHGRAKTESVLSSLFDGLERVEAAPAPALPAEETN